MTIPSIGIPPGKALLTLAAFLMCLSPGRRICVAAGTAPKPPNIVVVFTDDQGYSDVGCFGAKGFTTPHLDRMASEGTRLTSFYVSSPVCSASRAALLTGCYHSRVGVRGVFFPTRADKKKGTLPGPGTQGLNPAGITIAEMLKARGYATACFGKWHLGDAPPFLPTRQGFDEYFGIPYSNDMGWWEGLPPGARSEYPLIPLLDGEQATETSPDQRTLTRRYTERAVRFMREHQKQPFFLYLPHTMPHVPLFVSETFQGRTARGLYGDVIEEVDWSVGRILDTLKELDLDRNTLVVFTTDNGPWLAKGDHGGSARPLRDGKMTHYEGGQRVPCIVRWPGQVPAGRTLDGIAATIDLLPTLAGLTGGDVPVDRTIDGLDLWPWLSGQSDASPRDHFFVSTTVVRKGPWKLFLPGDYREVVPKDTARNYDHPRLYNLEKDIAEQNDVHAAQPDIVEELSALLAAYQADLQENSRPVGSLNKPQPSAE